MEVEKKDEYAAQGFRAPNAFHVATLLAANGFRILPTQIRTKIPCIREWPERATVHPNLVARWELQFKSPNWSILAGRENGVVILDIDGDKGRADLVRLQTQLGPLPQTWRVNSGRIDGGEHIWLRPSIGTNDDIRNQQPLPGFKIDVRGYHGHVVVPGSLHKSGNRYSWADGCAPGECELAECPAEWWDWLPKRIPDSERAVRVSGVRRAAAQTGKGFRAPHDPNSMRIGDGDGYGGFQNPIFANAKFYWRELGSDAPESRIVDSLRRIIERAPKGPGRDVSRYMVVGGDLERQVQRAWEFVFERETE